MQDLSISQDSAPTRTAEILDVLRADIIEARLAPDERLRFDALREQYNIGISPLREALTHLAAEGLVISEQRKGFRVAPVSRADMIEVARLRSEFDALAIAESIRHGNEIWEGRILAAFHALGRRPKIGPDGEVSPEWEAHHIRFHAELVSECRMPKLLAFRAILEFQARRYRRISVHYLTTPRNDLEEHRALQQAVIARDEALATRLIREHYMQTVAIILAQGDNAISD